MSILNGFNPKNICDGEAFNWFLIGLSIGFVIAVSVLTSVRLNYAI